MRSSLYSLLSVLLFVLVLPLKAQDNGSVVDKANYNAFELRNIGPAFTSGRIADIAIHPDDENLWYVAAGSGGVWKTENSGTTWEPIFDHQSSYSIGCVTIDPNNPHTVWVGTGENIGGRHVGYGDGIYRSNDGGETWESMGLENSEHISKIIVHPENSDIIWVAVQGPLWDKGGQRGLYKSTDGGKSWELVLSGNEWTGVTDLVIDPRNPDRLYAATWQRERTPFAYLGGGPGSGIHKSTDGGENWTELKHGLPTGKNMGKIGLAISPQKPDIIYATITLNRREGGVYMSKNRGSSWKKMSDAVPGGTGPHYYQELYANPHHFGTIYLMDVRAKVSHNHGKDFETLPTQAKHVDNHAMAFRDDDPNYLLMGTDGGVYESHDRADNWRFISNLPIIQYYKVAVDDEEPFYNVYGGTQDNGSHMGPSRTDHESGIRNDDWIKTLGADGHDTATEPDTSIFYAEAQQGDLYRIDRNTWDQVYIQPQVANDKEPNRFNWDTPVEVSFHKNSRIYTASQRVWRSNDRGNTWEALSDDLTLDQNRLTLPVMGKQRSWDNPWDVYAMSNYNTITSIGESPLNEDLIYVGTDDGRIQVTSNGGDSWREIPLSDIDEVPDKAFINDIKASIHDENTVYVAMDDHKNGDLAPYLIKSTDRGKSWKLISEDIPERHLVWRVVQDDVDEDLLFAATEFGIFFTVDGGNKWMELKGGAPTIAFRDITIQRDHDDLVAASFGRGFFILDNYSPLRDLNNKILAKNAHLFDTGKAYWYEEDDVEDSQGASRWTAENPPFGAVFTYYLKEGLETIKEKRQARERELNENEDVPFPGWDSLEDEKHQQHPRVYITITDKDGNVVRKVDGPTTAGFHRINWDLEYPNKNLVERDDRGGWYSGGWYSGGFMATPGTYHAHLSKMKDGSITVLSDTISFEVVPLQENTLERASNQTIAEFRRTMEKFQQNLSQTSNTLQEQIEQVEAMQKALTRADEEAPRLAQRLHNTRTTLLEIDKEMNGSKAKGEVGQLTPPTPRDRMYVGYRALGTTYGPTPMHVKTIEYGREQLDEIQTRLDNVVNNVMPELEEALQATGAPPVEE